jgi:hypothetical protein
VLKFSLFPALLISRCFKDNPLTHRCPPVQFRKMILEIQFYP